MRLLHPYPEQRFFASRRWQEPSAVTLHVQICARGGQQWPSLPRPVTLTVGLDLGDRWAQLCIIDQEGEVVDESGIG